jgi:hypothetical protein
MSRVALRTLFVLTVWIILASSRTQAEPSPSVRYLMNEQVSMFEWGIFLLEAQVKRFEWDDGLDIKKQFAHVEYDWPKNQLEIQVVVYPRYQSLQKTTARQVCSSLISQMKFHFGLDPRYPELRDMEGLGTFFHHKQFAKSDSPQTLETDLEAITNLEVQVMASKSDSPPFQETISCSSDLLKSEIRYFTTSETH